MASTTLMAVSINRGGAVAATTVISIVVTVVVVALRMLTCTHRKRRLGTDDWLLLLALLFGIISAICTGISVSDGLGKPILRVRPDAQNRYFSLSYSSNLFMILAMAASKHSLTMLISRSLPKTSYVQRYTSLFHLVIGFWMLFAVFGIAFECSLPMPWLYLPSRCAGHGAIWYPVAISNTVTDIFLAFGFIPIIREGQLSQKKQIAVAGLFQCRLIVAVFALVHIALLAPVLRSEDQTQDMVIPSILAQVMMGLSIVTAALPAFSRSLLSLEPTAVLNCVRNITPVALDPSHIRATSDENNKLRDWAFAQLRNSPSPSSLSKEVSIEAQSIPNETSLSRSSTLAPAIPPRSARRSVSPQLTAEFARSSIVTNFDGEKAWFVDARPKNTIKASTIPE